MPRISRIKGKKNISFDEFMESLQETNKRLETFCDFDKIERNVEGIKISLNTLNSLIGSKNLRKTVQNIWERDKKAFEVMGILIAVRKNKENKVINKDNESIFVETFFESVDGIMEFLEDTGLAEVFKKQKVKNLVDYVFGIETGLDTNARKNRGGNAMETFICDILEKEKILYRKQVSSKEWKSLTKILGDDEKKFDFVVEKNEKTYLLEVNYYNGGGSKLNEVVSGYTEVSKKINSLEGFEFVWVTDGTGWKSAKSKLKQAYSEIDNAYNIKNFCNFIEKVKGE